MQFGPTVTKKRPPSKLNRWSASGQMTPALLGLLAVAMILGSMFHRRGQFHVMRERVSTPADEQVRSLGPGGQDPVTLTRQANANATTPEFTSMILLPGRGMNLWQLTAFLPGRGDTSLLVSPPIGEASTLLAGTGSDANGSGSTSFGAAFLAPFASYLTGVPAPGTGILQTLWQSERLSFPAVSTGSTMSVEGLLLNRASDGLKVSNTQSGPTAVATFHAGAFGGGWTGDTDMTVQVDLSDHTLDMTVTAQNVGTTPEPFGIGWHPYFAIPGKDRANVSLVIPSTTHIMTPEKPGTAPSGDIDLTADSANQFYRASGTRLGKASIDETYLDLRSAVLADGPIAEFRDPAAGYGLRITPLTPTIKTLHVLAPANKNWVSIQPNMNVPDPLGHEWDKIDSTGLVVLQPGDSVVWKVRVEIFAIDHSVSMDSTSKDSATP
jgi:aldose 1-epimerase